MHIRNRKFLLATLISAVAALLVLVAWLATSWTTFYVPVSRELAIQFAGEGWDFGPSIPGRFSGGWSWSAGQFGQGGFFPDGWNAWISLVRRMPGQNTWLGNAWWGQTLCAVHARDLVFAFLVLPCIWVMLRFRRSSSRGFPVDV